MKRSRWMLLVLGVTIATACSSGKYVTQTEFDVFKADVKSSGEQVNRWSKAAHENILWLRQIVIANHCKPTNPCDPPVAPPEPPPSGGWGS